MLMADKTGAGREVLSRARTAPRRSRRDWSATARAQRNEDWLVDYTAGRPLYLGGKVQKRTLQQIADSYGLTVNAVWEGIQDARRIRKAVARALEDHEVD